MIGTLIFAGVIGLIYWVLKSSEPDWAGHAQHMAKHYQLDPNDPTSPLFWEK